MWNDVPSTVLEIHMIITIAQWVSNISQGPNSKINVLLMIVSCWYKPVRRKGKFLLLCGCSYATLADICFRFVCVFVSVNYMKDLWVVVVIVLIYESKPQTKSLTFHCGMSLYAVFYYHSKCYDVISIYHANIAVSFLPSTFGVLGHVYILLLGGRSRP